MSSGTLTKAYPDNGFCDADGRLTEAGQKALEDFFAQYPVPMKALAAGGPGKRGPKRTTYGLMMSMWRQGLLDIEEVDAEVRLSVARGIRRFDPVKAAERGAKLATYLVNWVMNGVQTAIGRANRDRRIQAMSIGTRADPNPCFTDPADRDTPTPGDGMDGPFGRLQRHVDRLPAVEKKVVYDACGYGKTRKMIACEIGQSTQYVTAVMKLVKSRLTDVAADE